MKRAGSGACLAVWLLAAPAWAESVSGAVLATTPGFMGVLAESFQLLLYSFFGLLALFLALIVWELVDSRKAPSVPAIPDMSGAGTMGARADAGGFQAVPPPADEDPFQSLLQEAGKAAAPPPSRGAPPPGPSRPAPPSEDEDVSPFMRLSQIGAEEEPAAPFSPPRVEVPAPPSPSPPAGGGGAAGGDWADLLRRVQQQEEPPAAQPGPEPGGAPPPVGPPGAEDPWQNLVGKGEAPPPPQAAGDADPWQSLLSKAAGESAGEWAEPPPARPAPGGRRISLEEGAPSSEDSRKTPRVISLNLGDEPGAPPQTEEE